ncbi:thiol-disulfide oxidoreductase DCC family protein [Halobacteriovorax sp. HLS]|uniref:thiol-disulfide oxidoreductase DCC family protein n=1 Tax=Halobacteriovorax sp. HLS TaxID=2234000 RepID=UPI000FDB8625|nr:DCC1-like thiol-disulfide oxidoreductase family protein [Halobacteriovorax sp. HLS]
MHSDSRAIIYFDGHCGLCNFFVDFLLKFDSKRVLFFSPLQKLDPHQLDFETVILKFNGRTYTESEAAIRAISLLPGPWKISLLLLVIPKTLRDYSYRLISKNRNKLFKRSSVCKVPTKEQRSRFL